MPNLDTETKKNLDLWLKGDYDETVKNEIKELLDKDPQSIIDGFYTTLSFGTGGLRGIMGVGSNRMNKYTIREATQGLANYINQQTEADKGHAVFIGYDSRRNSQFFAEESAKVLAGNGIKVILTPELRPTPFVSFGCRMLKCSAAIMITASHNPPEYNGYKVYWSDGAQIIPPHDAGIIQEVKKVTDPKMVKSVETIHHPLITFSDKALDEAYVEATIPHQLYPLQNKENGKDLKVVYTSLNGTGITLIPSTLRAWGFTNVEYVKEQIIPDGDFPTLKSPNPEDRAALQLGINLMQATAGDLLIANDPDADRVGVAVMHQDKVRILNGNEIACICLEHVIQGLLSQSRMPQNAAFIKTIATTELFQAICDANHKPCFNVLTGFKYIAERIRAWDEDPQNPYQFIFGGEESYGYLIGTQVRDKDAIISSALICEVALQAKLQGKSLVDFLEDIWKKYGLYQEYLVSVNYPETKEGKAKMALGTEKLRKESPKQILGIDVLVMEDYRNSTRTEVKTGATSKIDLPASDVLVFHLADKSKVMVRPSGTEPKIKLYGGVVVQKFDNVDQAVIEAQKHAEDLLLFVKKLIV